jgi:hypothetical protein
MTVQRQEDWIEHGPKTSSSINEIDYRTEQANHLQHLYLILCNDVDCKEAKQSNKKK